MKRWIFLFLSICMIAVLAACDLNSGGSSVSENDTVSSTDSVSVSGENPKYNPE